MDQSLESRVDTRWLRRIPQLRHMDLRRAWISRCLEVVDKHRSILPRADGGETSLG
ncbi:hypothetical protein RSAG8_03846, partial [Rhizoctonia solani AG-8 WAC10335]